MHTVFGMEDGHTVIIYNHTITLLTSTGNLQRTVVMLTRLSQRLEYQLTRNVTSTPFQSRHVRYLKWVYEVKTNGFVPTLRHKNGVCTCNVCLFSGFIGTGVMLPTNSGTNEW